MLDAIMGVPVIVKVLGALSLILIVNRFCRHLIVSVAIAALALGLWSGHSAGAMAEVAWERMSSSSSLLLMFIIFEVIGLSSQMAETGVMKDLVAAVRARVRRRTAMGVLPAVIGFLPMPGGALFSAPLVDSCDVDGSIAPGLKAQTNHWFRHIWEYWWPLYPGVLLAMKITGLEVWQFMVIGFPLSVCAIGAGYFFLLRHIEPEKGKSASDRSPTEDGPGLLALLLPIVVVIACYATMRLAYSGVRLMWKDMPEMSRHLPMAVGLCAAMLVLQWQRPLKVRRWRDVLLTPRALNMVAIVAAVLVYGAFIEAELPSGELLVARMHVEMKSCGIPMVAIIMLLPLISGLATGLSIGFVGPSFPIIFSLLGEAPALRVLLSTTVLAYSFGFIGQLLSPVHVCLVVTSQHFHTRVLRNVAGLLKPSAVVLIWATLLYFLIG